MNLENAIDRINKIDWNELGKPREGHDYFLAGDFLKRAAVFIKEQGIKPINPLVLDVVAVLGDKEEINYIEYCSLEVKKALENRCTVSYVINSYLKLVDYVNKNKDVEAYLQIYEPMIQLLEMGYAYGYREGGLLFYNGGFFPLNGWYERFLDKS